jgi:hypothetical protein
MASCRRMLIVVLVAQIYAKNRVYCLDNPNKIEMKNCDEKRKRQ